MAELFETFSRAELIAQLNIKESQLMELRLKEESDNAGVKQVRAQIVKEYEATIESIQRTLKNKVENPPAPVPNGTGNEVMLQSYIETSKSQLLVEVVNTVQKLKPGADIETFVANLDHIYSIEVQPMLAKHANLEAEFVRAAKRLMSGQMFTQLQTSGKATNTWATLKAYLIDTHGSKITTYQHLTRLWNCEMAEGEKPTDFAARLEEKLHTASLHIMKKYKKDHNNADMDADACFRLIGAMLCSIQVHKNHEDIYKSMIKGMDKHWSASSLMADAQDYTDRLAKDADVTKSGTEVTFHAKSSKGNTKQTSTNQKSGGSDTNKILKAIENLTLANKSKADSKPKPEPKKSDEQKSSKESNSKKNKWSAMTPEKKEELRKRLGNETCGNWINGKCKLGNECFRRHEFPSSHFVQNDSQATEIETSNQFNSLFQ